MAQAAVFLGSRFAPLQSRSALRLCPVKHEVQEIFGAMRASSYQRIVCRVTDTSTATPVTPSNGVLRGGDSDALADETKSSLKVRGPSSYKGTSLSVQAVITVIKKQRPDMNEQMVNAVDVVSDLMGEKIELQLVSTEVDPSTGVGKRSKGSFIKDWAVKAGVTADKVQYLAEFTVEGDFGEPGAILVRNKHQAELYLESVALQLPSGTVYFPCHSFVHATINNPSSRIFFSNKVYLPWETPAGLKDLRDKEMEVLRGNGKGERQRWERIYDYTVYNDLGDSDRSKELERPVLGGQKFPYPRRVRTGRRPCKSDKTKERRVEKGGTMYVPRDESFEQIKQTDFIANSLRGLVHRMVPAITDYFDETPGEFDAFSDIDKLYHQALDHDEKGQEATTAKVPGSSGFLGGVSIPDVVRALTAAREDKKQVKERNRILEALPIPDYYKQLIRPTTEPTSLFQYPLPKVLSKDKFAWIRDDEFARQTLAGMNPIAIECLKEFPPRSQLPPEAHGPQESAITAEHIEKQLEGLTAAEAVEAGRLFVLDYHDIFMPYINKINSLEGRKMYATRSVFFLHQDGCLMPVAIELCLPPSTAGTIGSRRVFTPGKEATGFWLWQLAKIHVCSNDSGYHQLVSHWLRTHACTEPYVIATYRQLSTLHPVAKLLHPHLRYTMEINAAARQNLINAGGVIESNFTAGPFALEMSAVVYDLKWRFDTEGLPYDLIQRGMAVPDTNAPHGLRLLIEDYPYAADGLLIWSSIDEWVREYIALYYPNSQAILADEELQQWWTEVRIQGHADKKDEPWWPNLETWEDLIKVLTTIIWIASGHHAAVNFGQFGYSGYVPNHPCLTRQLLPNQGDPAFKEFIRHPHKFVLRTLPSQSQATVLMTVVESLSTHSPDEEYLGYNGMHTNWTSDARAVKAYESFSARLMQADKEIHARNQNEKFKHRHGAGTLPYELLLPLSGPGITNRGIPNSISI